MFFNPSCGLCLYKSKLTERVYEKLHAIDPSLKPHGICCRRNPELPQGAVIINVCPSCDNHWRTRYEGIRTLSLYEYIDRLDAFFLPRYDQLTLTIHDPCLVRGRDSLYDSVRSLLRKMSITVREAPYNRDHAPCCGNSFFKRKDPAGAFCALDRCVLQLPCENVLTYCLTCMKMLSLGGKRPVFLLDLIMGEQTKPGSLDIKAWHRALDKAKWQDDRAFRYLESQSLKNTERK